MPGLTQGPLTIELGRCWRLRAAIYAGIGNPKDGSAERLRPNRPIVSAGRSPAGTATATRTDERPDRTAVAPAGAGRGKR